MKQTPMRRRFFILQAALFTFLILLLIGNSACKSRKYQTKYGPPMHENTDSPVTKYGAPVPFQ